MAVYTHINENDLEEFLMAYNVGGLVSFSGIAGGIENTNYDVRTKGGHFILTLFEKRVKVDDLPFFIAFMDHLRKNNIVCPVVFAAQNGKKISVLKDKPAILSSFLQGSAVQEITPAHCAQMGTLCAQMHEAAKTFPHTRKNTMGFDAWKNLLETCGTQADTLGRDLYAFLSAELAFLDKHLPKDMPARCVHADLFSDNIFFDDAGKICGVIDFSFSCTAPLVYDLMLTLNAWCFQNSIFNKTRALAFLAAYTAIRPLSAHARASLPLFGRAAALRIVATRLYDSLHLAPNALVTPKDPLEHIRILRFHQNALSACAYGLAA